MTIEKLIELLSTYKKDSLLTNELNEEFVHIINKSDGSVILSTARPIAECKRGEGYVYPTTTPGYFGFSPELGEDVYKFETCKLNKNRGD